MGDDARGLVPSLGRDAWVVLAGDAISGAGTGLTLPFLLIYLHRVRGIPLSIAGLGMASVALSTLVGSPLSGFLADRFGARITLIGGLVIAAAGAVLLTGVRHAWQAFVACAVIGLGHSASIPALDALLASVCPSDRRSAVFAARHATFNAGIGLGTLVAGFVVHPTSAGSFVLLYRLDAVSFLAFIPVLLTVRSTRPARDATGDAYASSAGDREVLGYREVLRDRALRGVLVLSVVLMAVGFGQIGSGFAGYVTRPGGVAPRVVAYALTANTVVVVGAQLFMLRLFNGWRRTAAVRLICAGFSVAWVLVLVGGRLGSGAGATVAFVAALAVFGVAETAVPVALPALVNDLAPDDRRGRYNALSSMSWEIGFLLAPALAGILLGAGRGELLFVGLIAVLGLVAAGSKRLERRLPASVNVVRA